MLVFRKFWAGIRLVAKAITGSTTRGDLEVLSTDSKIYYHDGTVNSPLLTEASTATIENKTIVVADNTITTAASVGLVATELNAALAELESEISTNTGDISTAQGDATQALADAATAQGDATQALADAATAQSTIDNHISDSVGAHAASAISNTPSGNLAATDVQTALNELQTDINSRSVALIAKDEASTLTSTMSSINFVGANVTATAVGDAVTITVGGGDVFGPASSTDNHIVRFDGTTGKLIQDGSTVVLSDAGAISGATGVSSSGTVVSTGTLQASGSLVEDFSTDSSTTGANATVASLATPVVRLTNTSLTSIDMLASPVAGRVLTIENASGNPITINNDTGGTAANRFLTGTKAALTLADEASIVVKYDATEARWMVIGGTGGSGSNSVGYSCFVGLNASEALSSWTTGDNATFLGAGALSGTFVKESTTPLSGLASYKYTQAAGSLNDYLASPAQSVDLMFRGQTVTISFPYTYNGANNDIEVILYDVTNAAIIPSSIFLQASTSVAIFKANFTVPLTTTSFRIGFQTKVLSSGAVFSFDNVSVCSDATAYADIANQTQSSAINQVASFTNATITGVNYSTSGSGIYSYNSSTGIYTALTTATIVAGASIKGGVNGVSVRIYKNVSIMSNSDSVLATDFYTSASASFPVVNGDTWYFTNASTFASTSQKITVTAIASSTHILTAPDTFSTDTSSLAYSSTYNLTTLATAPVGTYITYTYAANTNTRTQTSTRPTQTDADMNANGMLIYTRAYNAASTAAAPAVFAVQIGKGLKGSSVSLYKSAGKVIAGNLDKDNAISDTYSYGASYKDYNEITGILLIDTGLASNTVTSSFLRFSDISVQNSGYVVINASKNPALTGLNIGTVSAKYTQSSGQIIPSATDTTIIYPTKVWDTHAMINGSTGRITIPIAGKYSILGCCEFYDNLNGISMIIVGNISHSRLGTIKEHRNDITVGGSGAYSIMASTIVDCLVGDTMVYVVYQAGAGASKALKPSPSTNTLEVFKIGV